MKDQKKTNRIVVRIAGVKTSATVVSGSGMLISLHIPEIGRCYCSHGDMLCVTKYGAVLRLDEKTPAGCPCTADAFHKILAGA